MSTWRREALEKLPEFKELINSSKNPMILWIELQLEFDIAFDQNKVHLVNKILDYARWCKSEKSGRLPNDTSTAVVIAFYEHLDDQKYWEYLPKWFSKGEFLNEIIPILKYHNNNETIENITKIFNKGKNIEN